ncbi:hypothetical protein P280DRAFT_547178 [Massarina eburnea CBS 473.64]|uniref:Uncharacterized protein n=1 Tax=Massarina eburnea CBS 473.64 TaxID=1395130 RepID=A0A6A6S864_9PLEO|nr:hypothetical protein P280DRAFT_547178 [Massarina eburnea CBS 473.64]
MRNDQSLSHGRRSPTTTLIAAGCPPPKLGDMCTYKRKFHTHSGGYKSQLRQKMVVPNEVDYTPPGYEFVPSGNPFITRMCHNLAPTLYFVSCSESWSIFEEEEGIYVPADTFKQAVSELMANKARYDQSFCRDLDQKYPNAPPADRKKRHDLIELNSLDTASKILAVDMDKKSVNETAISEKWATKYVQDTVRNYIREQYTQSQPHSIYGMKPRTKEKGRMHRQFGDLSLLTW